LSQQLVSGHLFPLIEQRDLF
jgi:electron transfer flavoprotein alpha subunit